MNTSRSVWMVACVLSFAMGIGLTWFFTHDARDEVPTRPDLLTIDPGFGDRFMDDFFDDRFFARSRDPFKEMDRMQQRMEEEFDALRERTQPNAKPGWFGERFEHWFSDRFGSREAGAITMREDDQYIYYDVALGEQIAGDVSVKVEGNTLTIAAQTESRDAGSGDGTHFESHAMASFQQRFPLPANADPQSVNVEQGDGVVTVRIGKRS